jgi:uncharacterized repeat protein (TIGR01451 family)
LLSIVADVSSDLAIGATLADVATIASNAARFTDPDPTDNSAGVTSTVDAQNDVAVTVTAEHDELQPGSGVSYTVVVTNNGPRRASDVSLSNDLAQALVGSAAFLVAPDGLELLTEVPEPCTIVAATATCQLGDLRVVEQRRLRFTGTVPPGTAPGTALRHTALPGLRPDVGGRHQRLLRHVIPENRLRVDDVRQVIGTMADVGGVLELRRGFGLGMITSLIRIEGKPIGLIANNPAYLFGAVDSDGADRAARFMQLCDAFDLPILILCDTPGMMVGPEVEKTALVRHCNWLFVTGTNLSVPDSGRRPSSAAWASRARSSSASATGRCHREPRGSPGPLRAARRRRLRAGQGDPGRRVVPGRRCHRPRRLAALGRPSPRLDSPTAASRGQKRPFVDVW